MKKIRFQGKIYEIDCNDVMCGNCLYKPRSISEHKCKLFDILFDHLNNSKNDSWQRHFQCINAEVKE